MWVRGGSIGRGVTKRVGGGQKNGGLKQLRRQTEVADLQWNGMHSIPMHVAALPTSNTNVRYFRPPEKPRPHRSKKEASSIAGHMVESV